MMIKKLLGLLLGAVLLVSTMGTAMAATPDTAEAKLASVEKSMYGMEQTGPLMDRINHLEKDYEGAHSKAGMMERIDHLYSVLFDNSTQPSLITQMNAIEWGITHQVSMNSVQDRVTSMETTIEGKPTEGTYKARIDKLASFAFGSKTIPLTQVTVPANTLAKISLVTPVNAKNLKVGDTIKYQAAEDFIEYGMLVFAKCSAGEGMGKKGTHGRNFGRDAEVEIDFKTLLAVDGTNMDMFVGEEAKKEMKTMAMAAGASIAGMIILGPVGIITGAFVHGENIDLPAGTELYIQTKADTTVYAIPTTAAQ